MYYVTLRHYNKSNIELVEYEGENVESAFYFAELYAPKNEDYNVKIYRYGLHRSVDNLKEDEAVRIFSKKPKIIYDSDSNPRTACYYKKFLRSTKYENYSKN